LCADRCVRAAESRVLRHLEVRVSINLWRGAGLLGRHGEDIGRVSQRTSVRVTHASGVAGPGQMTFCLVEAEPRSSGPLNKGQKSTP